MSLNALKFTGVDHNPQTGICNNCLVPLVDAELISYTEQDEDITIEIEVNENNNPNPSLNTKSISQICLEYIHDTT